MNEPTTIEPKTYHKVFVYGSLKSGHGNHKFLDSSEFLGTTYTKDTNYLMFSFGAFPGVIKNDELGMASIEGELYLVDNTTMFKIDMLESNGQFYTRTEQELENGEKAWIYLIDANFRHNLDSDDEKIKASYIDDKLIFSWHNEKPAFNKLWNFYKE